MLRQNIKQFRTLLKQHPLFSSLYILGTALAIAATMILAIVYYIKIAPIYPEYNRGGTSYLTNVQFSKGEGNGVQHWAFSYNAVRDLFYPLENAEAVSAIYTYFWDSFGYVQSETSAGEIETLYKPVDPAFFRIYSFEFLEGKPFTHADFDSGIRVAVITEELAQKLFHTDKDVVGRIFEMDFIEYRVVGVVRGASFLTPKTYANLYIPFTTIDGYDESSSFDYMGGYYITILTNSSEQEKAMRAEINEMIRRVNQQNKDEFIMTIWQQPTSHLISVFQEFPVFPAEVYQVIRQLIYAILALLLVPALNLSGLISSRMDERLSEIGIRKSFGASRWILLNQIMGENLLLTLSGGLLGLLFSWLLLYTSRNWVFNLFDTVPEEVPEGINYVISSDMLFAPIVFVIALLLCILLNLLSALLPAWYALRKPITHSLYDKR